METSTLATTITNIGTVFSGVMDWGGTVVTFIESHPIMLVGVCAGFAFTAVALVKRLLP